MSAEATGWVWKYSPCQGSQLLVHLAIADVVNDIHGYEFWMSTDALSKKARVARSTVTSTLADLVSAGLLGVVQAGGASRQPTRYVFTPLARSDEPLARFGGSTSALSAHNTKELKEQKAASAFSGLVAECSACDKNGFVLTEQGEATKCSHGRPALELVDGATDWNQTRADLA